MAVKLEFKKDFGAAAGQWGKFWRGENTRPVVMATLPRTGVKVVEKPAYAAGAQGDFDPVVEQLLGWAETHEFLGDSIPFFYLEFAADHFAALLGAELEWRGEEPGGWAMPFVEELETAEIRFDREGKWWKRTVAFAQALKARCDGKLLIASNTLVGNVDALAAAYGAENLLMAMVENPDAVHRALEQIDKAHAEIVAALSELLEYGKWGSINRHGMYARGAINVPQCDFSCMISPEMFKEFVVPYLRREMARFEGVEYHLDGPDALKHLETLCEIGDLDVIQWVPGAGKGEQTDWTWLRDRIDRLGKGQLCWGDKEGLKRIWREYRSRTLVCGLAAGSRAEVEDAIGELEAMGKVIE